MDISWECTESGGRGQPVGGGLPVWVLEFCPEWCAGPWACNYVSGHFVLERVEKSHA